MTSEPITTEKKTLDLSTVEGVELLLEQREAAYETARKTLLASWQSQRKHMRALLAVLKDDASPPNKDSDTVEE